MLEARGLVPVAGGVASSAEILESGTYRHDAA